MICGAAMLLAAVSVGAIPVPTSVQRFPDPSWWPSVGTRQVGNMLEAIHTDAGNAFRSRGPGPRQLMARWRTARLTEDERVAILLGGATFHQLALLPAYADTFRTGNLRLRRAAAVGLGWLLGDRPVDPTAMGDDAKLWESYANFADALVRGSRESGLVRIWINSYLAAKGIPHHGLFINRSAPECLTAIREVAEPEDVNELAALWPLLDVKERYLVTTTFEMITGQRVTEVPQGQRAATGDFIYAAAADRLDAWIDNMCGPIDGPATFIANLTRAAQGTVTTSPAAAPFVKALDLRYPPHWPIAAEMLTAWGAPAADLDRQMLNNPANDEALRRVREFFPITRDEMRPQRERPNRKPNRR